jgi:hypothetical protein
MWYNKKMKKEVIVAKSKYWPITKERLERYAKGNHGDRACQVIGSKPVSKSKKKSTTKK